jgi:hypothetical protein
LKPALWTVGTAVIWAWFPLRDLAASLLLASVVLLPLCMFLTFYFGW